VNLIVWFLIGLFILIIMAVVSNSGSSSIDRIELQIFLINCPAPIYHGVATDLNINGLSVNYTITQTNYSGTSSFNGTYFDCYDANAGISDTPAPTVTAVIKEYGATAFDTIPFGWLGYLADYLTHGFQQGQALVTLLFYFATPANFSVLGFDLNDLSGIPLFIIISLYVFAYVPIALFAYKSISPFVGG
jgi:hypothetical protein